MLPGTCTTSTPLIDGPTLNSSPTDNLGSAETTALLTPYVVRSIPKKGQSWCSPSPSYVFTVMLIVNYIYPYCVRLYNSLICTSIICVIGCGVAARRNALLTMHQLYPGSLFCRTANALECPNQARNIHHSCHCRTSNTRNLDTTHSRSAHGRTLTPSEEAASLDSSNRRLPSCGSRAGSASQGFQKDLRASEKSRI